MHNAHNAQRDCSYFGCGRRTCTALQVNRLSFDDSMMGHHKRAIANMERRLAKVPRDHRDSSETEVRACMRADGRVHLSVCFLRGCVVYVLSFVVLLLFGVGVQQRLARLHWVCTALTSTPLFVCSEALFSFFLHENMHPPPRSRLGGDGGDGGDGWTDGWMVAICLALLGHCLSWLVVGACVRRR